MSTFNYARTVATANRLIAKFGQNGEVRRVPAGGGNPWDPGSAEPMKFPVRFAVTNYKKTEIDGTRVQAKDKKVLLAPGGMPADLATSDLLAEASGETFTIVDIEPVKPAETVVLWILQVRR